MNPILFLPLFIATVFLAFYIPGRVLLGRQENLSKLGIFAVSIILGAVLWGWQGYVFGFLQLRFLSYLYLLVFLGVFIKKNYFRIEIPKFQLKVVDFVVGLIVLVGIFGQVMPFAKTGLISQNGLFISTYNSCDHIWHSALAEEFAKGFPPNEPGLSGVALSNYNFWFHLITGELSRVFHLPLLSLQFSGLYPLAAILLAIIGYVFATNLYNSKAFVRFFLFFLFFAGDAIGWFISILNKQLLLNSSFGFDDAVKFMDTPGYGFSLIIVLAGLYVFLKNKQKLSWKNILIVGILIGSLIGFKVYMGIAFLIGFSFLGFFGLLKKKFSYVWIIIVAAFFSALQFLPFNAGSGGLSFLLFEVPRGFIAQKGFGLGFIDQRWTIYLQHHNYFRLFEYGFLITLLYLIVQFGIKFFGFFPSKKAVKILGSDLFVLFYSILISSLILSLFFYQKVGGGNIWQFLLPLSLMLTIFASLNLSIVFLKLNKVLTVIVVFTIIVFTIPSWISFVSAFFQLDYLSSFKGIPNAELKLYDYLKNNSPQNSVVLILDQPKYGSCPIASFAKVLTERNLYFSGAGVSGIITSEYLRRERDVNIVKTSGDYGKIDQILKKDRINYLVIFNNTSVATNSALLKNQSLNRVFINESGQIFHSSL